MGLGVELFESEEVSNFFLNCSPLEKIRSPERVITRGKVVLGYLAQDASIRILCLT